MSRGKTRFIKIPRPTNPPERSGPPPPFRDITPLPPRIVRVDNRIIEIAGYVPRIGFFYNRQPPVELKKPIFRSITPLRLVISFEFQRLMSSDRILTRFRMVGFSVRVPEEASSRSAGIDRGRSPSRLDKLQFRIKHIQ
jgi:hypothetical protein